MTRVNSMRMTAGAAALLACGSGAAGQNVLEAHPPPPTGAMSEPCLLLFDLEAVDEPVVVTGLTVASDANPGGTFHFDLLVRDGTSLGGSATSGAGSSIQGWTSLGEVEGVQGPIFSGPSLEVSVPRFIVRPGHLTGVALYSHYDWGFWFFRDFDHPYYVYSDDHLRLTTGDGRGINPFGPGQQYLAKCVLVGSITYTPDPCYPNCDGSTADPVLNVGDFLCFMTKFAEGDSYANCDGSTTDPTLNVADFLCFLQSFAAGCS